MVKKLIILRHGNYNSSGLTGDGMRQIRSVSPKIAEEIGNSQDACIISSTAIRAKQSADILSKILGIPYVENGKLHTEGGDLELDQSEEMLRIIDSCPNAYLIFVSHHEAAKYFPAILGKKKLQCFFSVFSIEKGEAKVIDCEALKEKVIR